MAVGTRLQSPAFEHTPATCLFSFPSWHFPRLFFPSLPVAETVESGEWGLLAGPGFQAQKMSHHASHSRLLCSVSQCL